MKVAQKRDAVLQGMFYFRKDICKGTAGPGLSGAPGPASLSRASVPFG